MNRRIRICLLLAIGWRSLPAVAANPALAAGPLYTASGTEAGNGDGDSPVFPQMQVLLDSGNPQETIIPSGLTLSVDGQDYGTASRVQPFNGSGHSVAAAFTIDVSGSMRGGPLNAVRAGLSHFVDDAGPRDHVAIQTVADEGRWDSAWIAPRAQLRTAIAGLTTRGKLTRLWDAVYEALGSYPAFPQARRLLVVSDGHDEGSSRTAEQVAALARLQHVPIDAIGVTRSNPLYLDYLETLAAQTGGHFRNAADEKQLEQLIGSGIKTIRNLPLASFEAKGLAADGRVHRFHITWNHAGQTAVAEFSAPVPLIAPPPESRNWIWIAAAVLGVLLLGGGGYAIFRKKSTPLAAVPQVPSPSASTQDLTSTLRPTPSPQPAIKRTSAVLPPRPFVPSDARANPPGVVPMPSLAPRPLARTQIAPRFPEPSPARPTAWLLGESGPPEGKEFAINAVEFWLGGLANNHLSIEPDPTISGNHACIVFDHGVLGIVDNSSTNGTWINEQRVGESRQLLRPGDRIRVGRSTFVLLATPTQPAAT